MMDLSAPAPFTDHDDGSELARNPNGLVPVIVDGDFVLWESTRIKLFRWDRATPMALILSITDPMHAIGVLRSRP